MMTSKTVIRRVDYVEKKKRYLYVEKKSKVGKPKKKPCLDFSALLSAKLFKLCLQPAQSSEPTLVEESNQHVVDQMEMVPTARRFHNIFQRTMNAWSTERIFPVLRNTIERASTFKTAITSNIEMEMLSREFQRLNSETGSVLPSREMVDFFSQFYNAPIEKSAAPSSIDQSVQSSSEKLEKIRNNIVWRSLTLTDKINQQLREYPEKQRLWNQSWVIFKMAMDVFSDTSLLESQHSVSIHERIAIYGNRSSTSIPKCRTLPANISVVPAMRNFLQ